MIKISEFTASLGTMSAEKRGPRSVVKCEMVLSADDIRTPTANLRAVPGSSGTMTVLR
jgi:hypothetical protein